MKKKGFTLIELMIV
ncbi:MAG: prepilin-type N-terminal cleavage/methylation domain-containing protein, partial [Candidatus Eremiobacteraeota bacterium]|nr:prepilin-type N-terminal cleavage/methylation domain-containing protein [Candidatus Eremiobacteraeota bacterium]